MFARAVFQTARFEEETAMSTDQGSNFDAVGYRNRAENPQERSKFTLFTLRIKLFLNVIFKLILRNLLCRIKSKLFNVIYLTFRQISSEEVIIAYVKRCKEVNPSINAIVEDRFDVAIQEARKIDSFLQSTTVDETKIASEKPLLGLPVTIKESIAVQGELHTSILLCVNKHV